MIPTEFFLDKFPEVIPYEPGNPNEVKHLTADFVTQSVYSNRSRVFLYALASLSSLGVFVSFVLVWPSLSTSLSLNYAVGIWVAIFLGMAALALSVVFMHNQIRRSSIQTRANLSQVIALREKRLKIGSASADTSAQDTKHDKGNE